MKSNASTLTSNGHGRQVRPLKPGKVRPATTSLARENLELRSQIAALKAEVARLNVRSEIMNLTSIVSESDLKGDITAVNDKFCEVSQYRREELLGHPHNLVRHPDMPKETFRQMWATIGQGGTFRGVIKNRRKDGSPYYVDAVIAPVLDQNGKPEKYLGVRYDITEVELERQNMQGVLEALHNNYAYIEYDVQGHILVINELFSKILGYRLEEVVGKHHRIFVDPASDILIWAGIKLSPLGDK